MIRRIRIRNYKSLRDVEVRLQPLTVLLGPNAAGKSNFMDALQLLSRIAQSRDLKEAFEPPYRGKPIESFAFDEAGLPGLVAKESASFSMEVDVSLSDAVVDATNRAIAEIKPTMEAGKANGHGLKAASFIHHRQLRYRIEVGIIPHTGALQVWDEYLAVLDRKGHPRTDRPKPYIERQGERFHLRIEGQSHPAYFDRFLSQTILSKPHYPPHHAHLFALKKEMENWFFYYFEPRERMRTPTSVKEVRHIGLMGEELAAFLHTLRVDDEKQFEALGRAMKTLIPSITGIETQVNKFGEVELNVVENGSAMPARVVSEGTLRVLGLLALSGVKEPASLIGFEEPENGVHPRRISAIARLLENRAADNVTQMVVTTHSPRLADSLPPESLYVCRKREGETTIEPIGSWGSLSLNADVEAGLDDESAGAELPISERILRGDFDD